MSDNASSMADAFTNYETQLRKVIIHDQAITDSVSNFADWHTDAIGGDFLYQNQDSEFVTKPTWVELVACICVA